MDEPTPRRHIVEAATDADIETAARIIAAAVLVLPVCQWLVPDRTQRRPILESVFALAVRHAVNHGTVDVLTHVGADGHAGDGLGVAVWVDRTEPVPPPPGYETRLKAAAGTNYGRISRLDALLKEHHPGGPHHHLAFLAVTPGHQGTGIGTALLRHHHQKLQDGHRSAYLEAPTEASERLYSRHGYVPLGPAFAVHDDAAFTPMWREPPARTSA